MLIDPDGDLCQVEDIITANRIFGTTYAIQDCGYLSDCRRHARHVNPISGDAIDVIYCELNMPKFGTTFLVLLICIVFILIFIYIKTQKKTINDQDNYFNNNSSSNFSKYR